MTITDSRHFISTDQFFDRSILDMLFESSKYMKGKAPGPLLQGKVLANLFYEPSTRTRFSFESAMTRLGGSTISAESAGQFSSAIKGEDLEDTIKIIGGYADAIVLRHPEPGSAERAAAVSSVPIINAGDGGKDHPTQALLDIFTILEELGSVEGLNIAVVGDLEHSRTIHSFLLLMGLFHPTILLISPEQLQLPSQYKHYLDDKNIKYRQVDSLSAVDGSTDIVYINRIQKERFADPLEYEKHKTCFILGNETLARMKPESRILNPLPRVGEIDPIIDTDPRAAYFRQAQNGLYVRMALLAHILG